MSFQHHHTQVPISTSEEAPTRLLLAAAASVRHTVAISLCKQEHRLSCLQLLYIVVTLLLLNLACLSECTPNTNFETHPRLASDLESSDLMTATDSLVLKAALLITRHGDRYGFLVIFCCAFGCSSHGFTISFFIHRTPIKTFPNSRSHWPEGMGQLTWLGMQQHYGTLSIQPTIYFLLISFLLTPELGQKFRERYVEQHKLLSSEFVGDEVYVRSTSKERTLMSAQVGEVSL